VLLTRCLLAATILLQLASAGSGQQATPKGATAKCKDGSYSRATSRAGACSHHGGVALWLVPSGATAVCNDGTYSMSQHRRGTCSRHHGVGRWLRELPP